MTVPLPHILDWTPLDPPRPEMSPDEMQAEIGRRIWP